ncbi:cytochrome P450 CYP82D47-like [Euphorbia lathyris]|uniref:cytochrome P450 CYP82D47-like n=1 Tax=Euphorbia lathyris TaxID=212925 RepID=UPI00331393F3
MSPSLNSFAIGITVILIFYYYYYLLITKPRSSKLKSPPQAGGAWPIIGHLPLLAGRELAHIRLAELADKYGPIFTIKIGIYPALIVNSWELAKELFTINDAAVSSRPKFTAARILGYDFVNFGFSPYGDYWREMRKIVALELLSNRRLELLKHIRASEVKDSIKNVYKLWTIKKDEAGQTLVDMSSLFNDINADVILRMVAGKRYCSAGNGGEGEAWKLKKTFRDFFHLAGLFVLRDALPFMGWLDFGGFEKAMKRNAKELDRIGSEWLDEHRSKGDHKQQDFMDVLLSVIDGPHIFGHDADLVKKVTAMTLIAGGTDTVTVSVTWGLALLMNHPTALRKAQEELDIQVGKERLVTESDIEKLVYLQAIVKETMRLHPAGGLTSREFNEDCTIGGYHIPAGTRLLVNLYTIHRDPRVWSNPSEFEPERFLNKHKGVDVKGQHYELIPFGAGRRACPGIGLGILMNHLLLASFLQAFEMSRPSNEELDMRSSAGLTNSKVTPIEVLLKPRLPAYLYQ